MLYQMGDIEQRYCRCIMHVANQYPSYNPYAVCTASVYRGKKRKGNIKCAETYRFEDFDTKDLRGYAKMKNAKSIKIPGAESMDREELIRALYRFVASEKGQEVWQNYVSTYRKEHPNLSFKQTVKEAAKEYHTEKSSIAKTRS